MGNTTIMRILRVHGRWAWLASAALFASMAPQAIGRAPADNVLRTYQVPQELLYKVHNDDFTVRVRQPGGAWHDLYEYAIQVDTDTKQNASMVYFDFSGSVEIEIAKNNGRFATVAVAPLSSKLRPARRGDVVRLTLTRPERFSLQFDDDRLHNLHIIAGSLPPLRPSGAGVRYFGPGLHRPDNGAAAFAVHSGEQIYLDGGAVLQGAFDLRGAHDVTIAGRGLLWDPGQAIELDGSARVTIADLIMVNSDRRDAARIMNIRNAHDVTVRDLTGFTSGKWSDGINISTAQHVRIDGGYLRVSDDAVVVYAVADCPLCRQREAQTGIKDPMPPGDTTDISVRNLRIWNDVAHSLFVGHFGDTGTPRTIADVRFENIDIMNMDEDDPDWDGAMAIFSGDGTLVRNVTFSDIRVDRIEEGRLFNIVAGRNARYNTLPGRGIDGVTLRNIRFTGKGLTRPALIHGLGEATAVRHVLIDHVTIAGQRILAARPGQIDIGPFVSDVTFR
ncbi:hypothetical protein [Novosphingobium sp. SG720]|uniref:hypothetical protein n=1 Tax=Novosphingobium sp. SG720 TaxID=2586998 RepID=UPI001445B6EB|nr:hypothetical protein [Novosphingobium sp. SG720]NKJ45123.1 hypothetical protein [Novosphingobium sp. SG720]